MKKESTSRVAVRPIGAAVWAFALLPIFAAGCSDDPVQPSGAIAPDVTAYLGVANDVVTPPPQHLRLGFTTTFPISDSRSESGFCASYSASINGTASLAVDMGADLTFSYDRADILPGGSVPIQITYTPADDAGPELAVDAAADVMMGVDVDDACLVGAGVLCGLGDPLACAAVALGIALDTFEGELDGFNLISASGDFTAPLGADPPVVVPGTGSSAVLQFVGADLVRATPVSSITLAPTPTGGFPGLGGAVALLDVSGADLASPPALIPVLEWQGPVMLAATIDLPATPGPSVTLTLSPILHWLQTTAALSIDIDLLGVLGAVFGDPSDISIFSGNLGAGLGLDALICAGVPAPAQPACMATVAAGNLPYPALLPQAPDPLPMIPPLAPFASAQLTIDLDSDDDGLLDGEELAIGTDPDDADTDDDELDDGLEVEVGTDPLDPDSDDDGIPDGEDVEWLQNVISDLPADVFKSTGPGHRTAMLSHLDAIEHLVAQGKIAQAIKKVQDLRSRVDGCGATADLDDWIVDCTAQLEVRALIDLFLANLSS